MARVPEIVVETRNVAVGYYGDVCVVVALAVADLDTVREFRERMTQLARRRPGGFGLLFIVASGARPPDGPARTAASEMFEAVRPHLKVLAAQIEGSGFFTAAKRSIFTWLTTRIIGQAQVKTFARLDDATDFLVASMKELGMDTPASDELQRFGRRLYPGSAA
jgi:hypothetical protein